MSQIRPGISVIIATRNRAESLAACLEHAGRVEYPNWELIVVDNASTDGTADVVRRFAATARMPIRLVHERRRGLTHAQNAGVRTARHGLLVFTDDDCYVQPDWLAEYTKAFEAHPEVGFAAGRIVLFDPADAPLTICLDEVERSFPAGSVIVPGRFSGANMAFRRSALDAIGGFDLFLGPGQRFQGCDLDACARASAAGFAGAYLPLPTVAHHHGRKPDSPEAQALEESYALGRGAYYAKCCLRAESRRGYAQWWFWSTQRFVRERQFRYVYCELRGALQYWMQRTLLHRAPLV